MRATVATVPQDSLLSHSGQGGKTTEAEDDTTHICIQVRMMRVGKHSINVLPTKT